MLTVPLCSGVVTKIQCFSPAGPQAPPLGQGCGFRGCETSSSPARGAAGALACDARSRPRLGPGPAAGKGLSHAEESVTLDNGGFAALELNSRHLNVKNTFSKKNGTR